MATDNGRTLTSDVLSHAEALIASLGVHSDIADRSDGAFQRFSAAYHVAAEHPAAVSEARRDLLSLADYDVMQLRAVVDSGTSDRSLVELLLERAAEDMQRLALHALAASRRPDRPKPPSQAETSGSHDRLQRLAHDYGEDAVRDRRFAAALFALSAVPAIGAVFAAVWAVHLAGRASPDAWPRIAGPLVLCAAGVVVALIFLRLASTRERGSRESVRLQRELAGVDAYLAPLPSPARHLLRATMAQTLFPRLLEDSDPMRATVWPEADVMLRSIQESGPDAGEGDLSTELNVI